MKTQLIAFYFPQFHAIPENNLWWGKGFSDWQLVKNALPIFNGHNQPRIPYDEDYYNPCDLSTLKKQIDIAKQYGIGGFMFYHYWFDGKLLLEKPLEVFLAHKELDMPFCICWANESWTRAWKGHPEETLITQTHVPKKEMWEKHFYYLLPFLKDERAMKVQDKVVILIYQPSLIKNSSQMLDYWRSLALKNGLSGLYFIAVKNHQNNNLDILKSYDGILKFQPREAYTTSEFSSSNLSAHFNFLRILPEYVLKYLRKLNMGISGYHVYDSCKLWNIILSKAYLRERGLEEKEVFESAFFEWDNTPRYGKKSKIFTRPADDFLRESLISLLRKAQENDSKFVFFNAWNEWSESAYLEPDTKYGYANLEIVRDSLNSI